MNRTVNRTVTVLSIVALVVTLFAVPQEARPQNAPDPLAGARAALQAGRADSALILLQHLTDSVGAPVTVRVNAWILAGIARFFQGNDSGASAAFRAALALDTSARAPGLSQIDSALARLFLAEHARLPTTAPAAPTDSVRECVVRRCLGGETMPVLTYFPHIDPGEAPEVEPPSGQNPSGAGLGQVGMHGEVVFLFVVTQQGFVDQATVRVVSSTARNWEPLLHRALLDARFRPALDGRGPVRARVQLRFDMRTEGLGTEGSRTVTYRIFGPGER